VIIYIPPEAEAGPDKSSDLNVLIPFTGIGSYDPDGTIVSYDWDWGDMTHISGAPASHAYSAKGTYTVTLKVTDDDGITDTDTCIVHIYIPPVASIGGGDRKLIINEIAAFDGSGSNDPDGTITSYEWDWGDGSAKTTGATAYHSWSIAGQYTVTLTVTDNDGRTARTTIRVTVITIASAIDELIALVQSMNIKNGIDNSLDVKLQHARDALTDAQNKYYKNAKSALESFINEVTAQSGKALTVDQATLLISKCQWIINNMLT
jgi:PKD repeat protein